MFPTKQPPNIKIAHRAAKQGAGAGPLGAGLPGVDLFNARAELLRRQALLALQAQQEAQQDRMEIDEEPENETSTIGFGTGC